MDWIHCNACFKRPQANAQVNFFLTSCGHLFCSGCIESFNNICKVCSTKFSAISLAPPLREDFAVFFTEPSDMYLRHQQEFLKILAFHKGHRLKLLNYHAIIADKYTMLSENFEKAIARINELEKENGNLKAHINQLKAAQDSYTPAPFSIGQNNFFIENNSLKTHINPLQSAQDSHNTSSCSLGQSNFFNRFNEVPSSASKVTLPMAKQTPNSLPKRLSIATPPSKGRAGSVPGSISSSSSNRSDVSDNFGGMINRYGPEERRKGHDNGQPKKFPTHELKSRQEVSSGRLDQPSVHGFGSSRSCNYSEVEEKKKIAIDKHYLDKFSKFRKY